MSVASKGWLSGKRLTVIASLLFAVELIIFTLLALATHGYFGPMNPPGSSDFLSFYAAGTLADHGDAAAAYDQARHWAVERVIFGDPRVPYYYYFYPPVFTVLCAALARLPYLTAFWLFQGATLALYVGTLRWITGGWRLPLMCLTFTAVPFVIGLGQNSFLTAALFGIGLKLLDRRPFAAGLVLGALCYKPHLALIAPLAFLAARKIKPVLGMALSGALLVTASIAILGLSPWHMYLADLGVARATFENGAIPFSGLVSLFAAIRLLGGGADLGYLVQGIGAMAGLVAIILVWGRPAPMALRAAILVAASLAAPPIILFYDLLPITIALAFLSVQARRDGDLPWERAAYALLWVIPGLVIMSGEFLRLPLGPLAIFLLLALALRRQRHEIAVDAAPRPVLNARLP